LRYNPNDGMDRGAWVILLFVATIILALIAGEKARSEEGIASFYWHGRMTASGEKFIPEGMTAAHKTLPFGTMVTVTTIANNRSVRVRINDRGPFVKGRIIDLSRAAARSIGMIDAGVAKVRIDVD